MTQEDKAILLQPTAIGKGTEHVLEMSNRVVMSPMTRGRSDDDFVPHDFMAKYYAQRASTGLIITEATAFNKAGAGWFRAPGIWTQEMIDAWKPITKAVHDKGGKIAMQLWHMGRQGHSDVIGHQPYSASEIPLTAPITAKNGEKKDPEVPKSITVEEIAQTVKEFGEGARNALEAGFDAVEIHGANGYLVDQFSQSKTNKRTDQYGGSIENRLRFMREVVEECLKYVPKERLGIRLSPNGKFGEMGSEDNNETFTEAIRFLAGKRLGFIDLMDGLGFGFHELSEPFTAKMARDIIREVQKDEGVATMLFVNVGYTKESAEAELKAAQAEEPYVDTAVAFGRPLISTPDLVERFENGWELNPDAEYPTWWHYNTEQGYTDFPTYEELQEQKKVK
mmetsp:Transcript_4171/g.7288  ORF Transcript_4171/g.7288 Transcript_4171/m.7288 type:complete len:394 (-) Transcript_4171:138-1319(-)